MIASGRGALGPCAGLTAHTMSVRGIIRIGCLRLRFQVGVPHGGVIARRLFKWPGARWWQPVGTTQAVVVIVVVVAVKGQVVKVVADGGSGAVVGVVVGGCTATDLHKLQLVVGRAGC